MKNIFFFKQLLIWLSHFCTNEVNVEIFKGEEGKLIRSFKHFTA